ncbi:PilZ domain-containing protein [Thioalkalivibrio sp. HL-Eb18]|uniref:PilZ domain-containing protein n=1 Tax=Thioalkalivibrio sp. HL-Eb18 TaxID=1266913 RepID=UPI000361B964|nr:PilZ domain-containing protein [Thioalkalivibrio sp. HL-Eb18]
MLGEDDRRGFRRMQVDTPARVTWTATGAVDEVRLEDLSASGCAFRWPHAPQAGERVSIAVHSPDGRVPALERAGEVVRSEPLGEDRVIWRVAIVFDSEG